MELFSTTGTVAKHAPPLDARTELRNGSRTERWNIVMKQVQEMNKRLGIGFGILAISLPPVASLATAGIVTLSSVRDNTIYEDSTGSLSNGAGEYFFVGLTGAGGIRRGLVRFNPSVLPADARITRAALRIYVSRAQVGASPVQIYRVLAEWGEGISDAGERSGVGAPATTNDATWLHRRYPGQFWATPGGDFAAAPSATITLGGSGAQYESMPSAGLIADIEAWRNSPGSNFGWCLIGDESQTSAKRCNTRESISPETRPTLFIEYRLGPALPADMNCDGMVNFADIDGFVPALVDRAAYEAAYPGCEWLSADVNRDGVVNFDDITGFVICLIEAGCPE